jgi:hypothetical protein
MADVQSLITRSRSSPLPFTSHFCQVQNDVVLPMQRTLKYIDILPPPSMLYYNDTFHRVFTDMNMHRYIKYKGEPVYLKDIIGQYYYSYPID